MNKIKEIEEILAEWKAREDRAKEKGLTGQEAEAGSVQHGLTLALKVLKQPSNTQI